MADRKVTQQTGFTLIELMIVIVIIAIVWVAALPMVQPNQQRQARDWQQQAQALLTLSCDLAVQTMQTHRVVLNKQTLQLEHWSRNAWMRVEDVAPLPILPEWQLTPEVMPKPKQGDTLAWLCRPDGEQTAGKISLSRPEQGKVLLTWRGDGRYEHTTGL